MNKKLKTFIVWTTLVLGFLLLYKVIAQKPQLRTLPFETFLSDVENEDVSEVKVDHNQLIVSLWGKQNAYRTLGVIDNDLTKKLSLQGVEISEREKDESSWLTLIAGNLLPLVILVAVWIFFMKRMGGGKGETWMSLRKSRAKLVPDSVKTTFAQVGGCEEAKEALADVVDFIKSPDKWRQAGARLPRGILLEGPSGCGKTLLARAVAGETDANFFAVSASEFVELFVGIGAARIRDMFENAAKKPPAVIFIDEIDAVGRRRGSGIGIGHDEREQTLNQLLVCMDGFQPTDQIVVIAATNRADILDPALVRPGRFDRKVTIPALSDGARLDVLRIHTKGKTLAEDVSLEAIAKETAGMTGAQLESMVNEAALLAVRRARKEKGATVKITPSDIKAALNPSYAPEKKFSHLDQILIESATQLAQPRGSAAVELLLRSGEKLAGEVVWADAAMIKLHLTSGADVLIPKRQVQRCSAVGGENGLSRDDISVDAWAGKLPGAA